jgi:hypothetical protein
MIQTFCGIGPERIHRYSRQDDLLICRRVCLPSFAHDGAYALHALVQAFYGQFGDSGLGDTKRRICLSRPDQEIDTF